VIDACLAEVLRIAQRLSKGPVVRIRSSGSRSWPLAEVGRTEDDVAGAFEVAVAIGEERVEAAMAAKCRSRPS
jgi:hypothetical protein